MQSAQLPHHSLAGAEMEMVGIAEDDLCAGAGHFRRMQSAHGAVGPHRHERRCLDRPMRQGEEAGAGGTLSGEQLKVERGHGVRR